MGFLKGLQKRWGLKSGWQAFIILIVFACTGLSALFAKNAFYFLMNIDPKTLSIWVKISISLFSLIFLYPAFLLFYGFMFGEFKFFWEFKKRMFKRISDKLSSKNNTDSN